MRTNIEKKLHEVESHPDVESVSVDYDDGEVVLIAMLEEFNEAFELFLDDTDLSISSGPKHVGVGIEVTLR